MNLFQTKAANVAGVDELNGEVGVGVIATEDLKLGAGLAAKLQKLDLIKVDLGVYVVKPLVDILDANAPVEVRLSLGGSFRF